MAPCENLEADQPKNVIKVQINEIDISNKDRGWNTLCNYPIIQPNQKYI